MPVARKSRRIKSLKGRVQQITSSDAWEALLQKQGGRVIFIHFSAGWALPCKKVRPVLNDLSRKAEYSHIIFVEIDADKLPEVAQAAGVRTLPSFQCWKDGKCIEGAKASGGSSISMAQLLNTYGGERSQPPQRSWRSNAVKALCVGGAVAAAWLLMRQQGSSPAAQMRKVDKQIQAVQREVAMAARAKRTKAARNAKEKLADLNRQRAELEQGELRESQPLNVRSSGGPRPAQTAPSPTFGDSSDDEDIASQQLSEVFQGSSPIDSMADDVAEVEAGLYDSDDDE